MITGDQIAAHLVGDYLLQSHWMASKKRSSFVPAAVHALCYSILFIAFRPSIAAWLTILVTHYFMDRYGLARYVVWLKNFLGPINLQHPKKHPVFTIRWGSPNPRWVDCSATGYPNALLDPGAPAWLAVWLLIIADNTIHLLINGLALKFL